MIRTVISDMGNVLLAFDVLVFLNEIAKYSSMKNKEVLEVPFLHDGLIEAFCKGNIGPKKYYREMGKIFKADIEYQDFINIYCNIFSLNSSVVKTLTRLKGKNKLILLSNTDTLHFNFIKKRYPEIFIFDDYILSYKIGSVKPETEIFDVALDRSETKPEEIVFIDDMKENIQAAKKIGMKTIHFHPKMDLKSELKKLGMCF